MPSMARPDALRARWAKLSFAERSAKMKAIAPGGVRARSEKVSSERRKEIASGAMKARLTGLSEEQIKKVMSAMGKSGAEKRWVKLSKDEKSKEMTDLAAKLSKEQRSDKAKKAWVTKKKKAAEKRLVALKERYNQLDEQLRLIRVNGKEPSKELIDEINKVALQITEAEALKNQASAK